jgi:hypothetical protein
LKMMNYARDEMGRVKSIVARLRSAALRKARLWSLSANTTNKPIFDMFLQIIDSEDCG